MIVLETSALIAILFGEPTAPAIRQRLADDTDRAMSTASYVEAATVLAGRRGGDVLQVISDLDAILDEAGVQLEAVDEAQARLAVQARVRFGRGFGGAGGLNFGDCFAYALAKSLDAPLLYVGDDFARTDVTTAL